MSYWKLYFQFRRVSTSKSNQSALRNVIDKAFTKHLLFTNLASSGLLMAFGDIAQQEIEYQRGLLEKRYDLLRLARMTAVGLMFGPIHHYFYVYLNKWYPKTDMKSISKKILADQFLMSPACIVTFFYGMGVLESKTVTEATDELKDKFMDVYKVDWLVWPPTQFLNFYYVPAKYQVLCVNAVTMLYDVFLSYIKHRDKEKLEAVTEHKVQF